MSFETDALRITLIADRILADRDSGYCRCHTFDKDRCGPHMMVEDATERWDVAYTAAYTAACQVIGCDDHYAGEHATTYAEADHKVRVGVA